MMTTDSALSVWFRLVHVRHNAWLEAVLVGKTAERTRRLRIGIWNVFLLMSSSSGANGGSDEEVSGCSWMSPTKTRGTDVADLHEDWKLFYSGVDPPMAILKPRLKRSVLTVLQAYAWMIRPPFSRMRGDRQRQMKEPFNVWLHSKRMNSIEACVRPPCWPLGRSKNDLVKNSENDSNPISVSQGRARWRSWIGFRTNRFFGSIDTWSDGLCWGLYHHVCQSLSVRGKATSWESVTQEREDACESRLITPDSVQSFTVLLQSGCFPGSRDGEARPIEREERSTVMPTSLYTWTKNNSLFYIPPAVVDK